MIEPTYYELKTPQIMDDFEIYYCPYESFRMNGVICYKCKLTINGKDYELFMKTNEVDKYITNRLEEENETNTNQPT